MAVSEVMGLPLVIIHLSMDFPLWTSQLLGILHLWKPHMGGSIIMKDPKSLTIYLLEIRHKKMDGGTPGSRRHAHIDFTTKKILGLYESFWHAGAMKDWGCEVNRWVSKWFFAMPIVWHERIWKPCSSRSSRSRSRRSSSSSRSNSSR